MGITSFRVYNGAIEFILEQPGHLFGKVYSVEVVDGKPILYNVSATGGKVSMDKAFSAALLACEQLYYPSKDGRAKLLKARKEVISKPTDYNMAVSHFCSEVWGEKGHSYWMKHYISKL